MIGLLVKCCVSNSWHSIQVIFNKTCMHDEPYDLCTWYSLCKAWPKSSRVILLFPKFLYPVTKQGELLTIRPFFITNRFTDYFFLKVEGIGKIKRRILRCTAKSTILICYFSTCIVPGFLPGNSYGMLGGEGTLIFFFVIKIGAISSILNKFTVIMYFYFRYKHTVCMFI